MRAKFGYICDRDGYTGHSGDQNPMPFSVMVLKFQPELTHSTWCDFRHRCRSVETLKKLLLKMTKDGDIVGYRLIKIYQETIGVESK